MGLNMVLAAVKFESDVLVEKGMRVGFWRHVRSEDMSF
jgi:hypothetical protein